MKAICTRYSGPTDHRGSRIVAYDSDNNRVSLSWDDGLNSDENHRKAAYALRDKMGWQGELIDGSTRDGRVWVFLPSVNDRALRTTREQIESAKAMTATYGISQHHIGYVRGWQEAMKEMGLLTAEQIDQLEREIFSS